MSPNVWIHSSVGRASHRYRGGPTGSNLVEALTFSGCDDHSLLSEGLSLRRRMTPCGNNTLYNNTLYLERVARNSCNN